MAELIFRNLAEVLGKDAIDNKLAEGRSLIAYIGFAPTGQIHLGYLIPCMKIRDLTLAGCRVAIMIADVHALLDERKTPRHLVDLRSEYYEEVLGFLLEILGTDMRRVKFVRGSEFQLTGEYSMDVLDLASQVTIAAAKKAGTEVVKQSKDPRLGSAIYPVMQAVDENYVGQATFGAQADIELGGVDQRKIFVFSHDWKQANEEVQISYLMNPIVSLAKSGKMSASDPNGKISFTDADNVIETKIAKAFCADGDPDCGLMKFMKCVFFPLGKANEIIIDKITFRFSNYEEFEKEFQAGTFVAKQLKQMSAQLICDLIVPIRNFLATSEMNQLILAAYN